MRVNLGKTPLWTVYHCRKEREAYLFNINLVNNMFYVVFATSGGKTFHNIAHCLDQGCIFFPKIEFFINDYLEALSFLNKNGQFFITSRRFFIKNR